MLLTQKYLRKHFGFSLLEVMITLLILGIIIGISYPLYTQHVVATRRTEAKTALFDLAVRMERFYTEQNSYAGATFDKLSVAPKTSHDFYSLTITSTDSSYLLKAVPQGIQAENDKGCATLTLDQHGVKNITGTDSQHHCW